VTGSPDDLTTAMQRLRAAVRDEVPVPPAAGLRVRATRQRRARRTATAVLAAAVVGALAIGGVQVIDLAAGPPAPPAGTPTPTSTPTPTAAPEVTPSPRPVPLPLPEPPDDPIARVDWRNATITLPPQDGCPDGSVDFVAVSDIYPVAIGPPDGAPQLSIDATWAAYGDLTGDGVPEVVLPAGCRTSESVEDGDDDPVLLVVTRAADGTLTALGYVDAPGTIPLSWWVEDRALLVEAGAGTAGPGDDPPAPPGLVLRHSWTGGGFTGGEPAAEYPPLVPPDPGALPPPVRPRAAVAAALGCPDDELRFVAEPSGGLWSASASEALYVINAQRLRRYPALQRYLFDLDNTGDRLLVTAVACVEPDGTGREGIVVFERAGDGWQGISVLRHRRDAEPLAWYVSLDSFLAGGDLLQVEWSGEQMPTTYRWNGTELAPVS
jgi:hypothetical protein